jgi:citronellol/citronellal dehydrogenase
MAKLLQGQTILITGSSRGIGRAIALAAAKDGANIVIAAKTAEPHPKLPGTIHTVAAEVEALGVVAMPVQVDVRDETQAAALMEAIERRFGRLDALVNNAGAISLTPVAATPVKRFDLMQAVNSRALFVFAQAALPLLSRAESAHVISLSPPLNPRERWIAPHAPYTLSKFGMTLLALGMAGEFRDRGISVSCLWPRTTIATAAIEFAVGGAALLARSRTPEIVADAAIEILRTRDGSLTGRCLVDEDLLRERGIADFKKYAADPANADSLQTDLYIDTP